MILVTLRVVTSAERRTEIWRTLRSLLGRTQAEAGCAGCSLYRDMEDENALLLVEEWNTRADLERHIQSKRYRTVLAVMEAAKEPPELKIHSVVSTAGMEALLTRQPHTGDG